VLLLTGTEPSLKKELVMLPVTTSTTNTTTTTLTPAAVTLTPVPVANLMPPEYNNKPPTVAVDPLAQMPLIVTTSTNIVSTPVTMHLGFDMSLPASPPTQSQQHSSNGFTHVASIPAMQPIKAEPSPPYGGYNNGMQMATGVPSIFDPLPATSLATTVMQNQMAKKEEKTVLPIVIQPTVNKPVNDGESVSICLWHVIRNLIIYKHAVLPGLPKKRLMYVNCTPPNQTSGNQSKHSLSSYENSDPLI
jgi:hypothetical protein